MLQFIELVAFFSKFNRFRQNAIILSKKILSDIRSGRRFVVHVLYLIAMRHFPRPSFRWGVRLPPFRGIRAFR